MRTSKMTIGQAVAEIPGISRKHRKTRVDLVRRALGRAEPGTILPIYTQSVAAANSLAMALRKGRGLTGTIAVRKHIVYVEKAAKPEPTTPTDNTVTITMVDPAAVTN